MNPKLVYDKETHRYSLSAEHLDGRPYQDERALENALKTQSRNLYLWIYSRIPKFNRGLVEYMLAKDENYIQAIFDALTICYEADARSGFSDIQNYGMDNNNQFISDKDTIEKLIPASAKLAIESACGEYNIFYSGLLPELPKDRYERYDY